MSNMTKIAAIILASGESRRMGYPKLTIEFEGQTLLTRAIQKAQTFADEIIVIVGAYANLYREEAEKSNVTVLDNPIWQEGMGSTVKTGIAALSNDVDGVILMLPDQPFVPLEHFQALIDTQRETNSSLVFSKYTDTNLGVPALIHKQNFQDALHLPSNCGAKALIKYADSIADVALQESFAKDIDTPQDVETWLMSP